MKENSQEEMPVATDREGPRGIWKGFLEPQEGNGPESHGRAIPPAAVSAPVSTPGRSTAETSYEWGSAGWKDKWTRVVRE